MVAPDFCGGIEGAKCDSEGKKSKNLKKMADFGHFFSSDWGGKWGEPPTEGNAPLMPPLPPKPSQAMDKDLLLQQRQVCGRTYLFAAPSL